MTRASDVSIYDDDFFAWTQEQAAALRRLPHETGGEAVDIANLAEEIEDLGKRDLREVASFLARLIQHLLKLASATGEIDVPHWRSESMLFQMSARDAFSPSMRRVLSVNRIWKDGVRLARASGVTAVVPESCPLTLDELLDEDFDLDTALCRVIAARPGAEA